MASFHELSSWDQTLRLSAGIFIVLLLIYYVYEALKPPFFTTVSPEKNYTVQLYGQKERPAFFTVEVGMVVLKNGYVFWPYQTLHSGDFMDLSFELGWPEHRWIGNNILQFYSESNFSQTKCAERIYLRNNSANKIRRLQITSNNEKFLGFDLPLGFETQLTASPTKGDSSGLFVEGKYSEGEQFENSRASRRLSPNKCVDYNVFFTDNGIVIDNQPPNAP